MNQSIKTRRANYYNNAFATYQKRISLLATSALVFNHNNDFQSEAIMKEEINLLKSDILFIEAKDWLTEKGLI